jgi:hypothetical protein
VFNDANYGKKEIPRPRQQKKTPSKPRCDAEVTKKTSPKARSFFFLFVSTTTTVDRRRHHGPGTTVRPKKLYDKKKYK